MVVEVVVLVGLDSLRVESPADIRGRGERDRGMLEVGEKKRRAVGAADEKNDDDKGWGNWCRDALAGESQARRGGEARLWKG